MPLAYSYRRFSTPEQSKGNSITRQENAFNALCSKHGWTPAITYFDAGKSGWKGDSQKALKAFLDLLKKGQIPEGSTLVIESLDRVSRKGALKTVRIIMDIIENNVAVATTNPERIYTESTLEKGLEGMMQLMEIILTAERAREESETKSVRVRAAAFSRHKRARETGELMTRRTPSWLARVGDKWQVIPERVAVVKRIFNLSLTEGLGQRAIAKRLNAEGVPTFGKGKAWGWAMVRIILVDGRVTGTFKSKLGDIPDYFPAVISKADYSRVLLLTKKRERFRGRTSEKIANLFTGLAYDVETSSTMVYVKKGRDIPARWIPSVYEMKGKAAGNSVSFNYDLFESVFLNFAKELTLPQENESRKDSGELEQELDQLDLQIETLKQSIANANASHIPEMVDLVASLSRKRVDLANRIAESNLQSTGDALHVAKTIVERLAEAQGKELVELRSQLRQTIRNLVSRIDVQIKRNGYSTKMLATIHFTNGQFRLLGIFTYRGVLDSVFTNQNELTSMNDAMELEVSA